MVIDGRGVVVDQLERLAALRERVERGEDVDGEAVDGYRAAWWAVLTARAEAVAAFRAGWRRIEGALIPIILDDGKISASQLAGVDSWQHLVSGETLSAGDFHGREAAVSSATWLAAADAAEDVHGLPRGTLTREKAPRDQLLDDQFG